MLQKRLHCLPVRVMPQLPAPWSSHHPRFAECFRQSISTCMSRLKYAIFPECSEWIFVLSPMLGLSNVMSITPCVYIWQNTCERGIHIVRAGYAEFFCDFTESQNGWFCNLNDYMYMTYHTCSAHTAKSYHTKILHVQLLLHVFLSLLYFAIYTHKELKFFQSRCKFSGIFLEKKTFFILFWFSPDLQNAVLILHFRPSLKLHTSAPTNGDSITMAWYPKLIIDIYKLIHKPRLKGAFDNSCCFVLTALTGAWMAIMETPWTENPAAHACAQGHLQAWVFLHVPVTRTPRLQN